MRRRTDELSRWHCSHVCNHVVQYADAHPKAWRYAVVQTSYAFALIVSPLGGEFSLHRRIVLPDEDKHDFVKCDLLGSTCILSVDADSLYVTDRQANPLRSERANVNYALDWWAKHASQGLLEQPDAFWTALEKLGKEWMRDVKKDARLRVKCPHCGGKGFVKETKKR